MQVKRGNRSLISNDKRKSGGKGRKGPRIPKRNSRLQVYGAAGSQLYRDVKWLISVVNVEDKYVDTNNSIAFTNAWQYALLNPVSQGTTPNTRIGQSIKTVGLEFRFNAFINAASTASQTIRIMIFKDKQPNGANPGVADVYPAGSLTPRVVGYLDRFQIMFERTYVLNTVNTTIITEAYIETMGFHVEFNTGNAGTIADITVNSVFVGFFSDQAVSLPQFSYNSRFAYVDN